MDIVYHSSEKTILFRISFVEQQKSAIFDILVLVVN